MRKHGCFALWLGAAFCVNAADAPWHLTLADAEKIALERHPRISIAKLDALAAREEINVARAAYFPSAYLSATAAGVGDTNNTRIAAGGLNNPTVYEREADGVTISQLITDFGRTSDLTQTAKLNSQAQEMNREATQNEILLEVNAAYFSALQAQSVLDVARQTEKSRGLVLQQIQTMATNKLRSDLDVSFASVALDQAHLLAAKAGSDVQSAYATLSMTLGEREAREFELVDEPAPEPMTNAAPDLVIQALSSRPELARLQFERDAARKFALAQNKLAYPTLSAVGTGGIVPVGDPRLPDNYAAAGINLNLPLFAGGIYKARQREAADRAEAASEIVRDEENTIAHDVQISKLRLDYSFQRMTLAAHLLQNANTALEFAQARFNVGAGSIVELSQAELNQTSAQLEVTSAKYDCQLQRAELDFQIGILR